MRQLSRRKLLKNSTSLLALPDLTACSTTSPSSEWADAKRIRQAIQLPVFPRATWDIRERGAPESGQGDATSAIQDSIDSCHLAGGGKVSVPPGFWATRALNLKSNVNLHLEKGAHLRFSTRPEHYLPAVFTRWEGVEMMGYSPLIYAYQQHNIAITGEGVLDGQASPDHWWSWKGENWSRFGVPNQAASRQQLFAAAERDMPVADRQFAQGHYLRPSFIQPYQCSRVLIEGVTVINAPFWLVHPVLCQHVTLRDLRLQSLGPNSDGIDPESCDHVLIERCFFDTGDDCIAIKSGRNRDGRRLNVPSRNILISQCKMQRGHGGVVIGSEISGGVHNVFIEQCIMSSPDLERGLRIKTNAMRGGVIRNIHARQITIGQVQDAIVINFYYEEAEKGDFMPQVSDISISELLCSDAKRVFELRGFSQAPIRNLRLQGCHFKHAEAIGELQYLHNFQVVRSSVNGIPYAAASGHPSSEKIIR